MAGNEIALHSQSYSYILESDNLEDEHEESECQMLGRKLVLFEWDEGLRECKRKEAAFKCFMEFNGSADIVR